LKTLHFFTPTEHRKCCQFRCRVLFKLCTSLQFTISGYQRGKENEIKCKFCHFCLGSVPRQSISLYSRSSNLILCGFFFAFLDQRKTYDQKRKTLMKCNNKFEILFNAVPLDFLMGSSCRRSDIGVDVIQRICVSPCQSCLQLPMTLHRVTVN